MPRDPTLGFETLPLNPIFPSLDSVPLPLRLEARFWKTYQFPILFQQKGRVNHINFTSNSHNYAVCTGTTIDIFEAHSNKVVKRFSKFKEHVRCACFRQDTKLLVGSGDEGIIRVFSIEDKSLLRIYKSAHSGPIYRTSFLPLDPTQIVSASDDCTIGLWDLSTGSNITKLSGSHRDKIRCVEGSPKCHWLLASGSLDHTICLWDIRQKSPITKFKHGEPINDLIFHPSGNIIFSAGGKTVKSWDVLSSDNEKGELITTHQKLITSICIDGSQTKLLSGSLDQQLKVVQLSENKVVHTFKYSAAISALSISGDDSHLVVGMTDGLLSIRKKTKGKVPLIEEKDPLLEALKPTPPPPKKKQKTADTTEKIDIEVTIKKYDTDLRTFKYKRALTHALKTNQPSTVIAVIIELIERKGIELALIGRSESSLLPVLQFLCQNITDPRFTSLLIDISVLVLDLYQDIATESSIIQHKMVELSNVIRAEIELQGQLTRVQGSLDLLISQHF